MTHPRRGIVLPMVLVALVLAGMAAAASAWLARARWAAERAARAADHRFAVADSLLAEAPCVAASAGQLIRAAHATAAGPALVMVRHVEGACWVSVAVGDTLPIVGALVTVQSQVVTPLANASPVVLPSIDDPSEFPSPRRAPSAGRERGRRLPGPAWLDLR